MDFGIQFKTKNNWNFGLMARDITTTYNSWSINQDRLDDIQNAIEGQNQEVPNGTAKHNMSSVQCMKCTYISIK